ncbi:MAG: T9SS type A sorting domain-containing protein [Saprospiraceae bacterium]|nr:T9SS type A sorting domain-containing protein [Saprospiraceae bacterium]
MTKSFITCLLLLAIGLRLDAQACDAPNAQLDIQGNNIKARLLNGGDLFWDLNDGQFIPNPTPGGNDPTTIYSAGLWIGGVDPAYNLKISAAHYRFNNKTDFWPGPLDPATGTSEANTCANWDRIFKVKGADVTAFLAALPSLQGDPAAAIAQFPSIMGWPGEGNAYFSQVWGFDLPFTAQSLAGFYDFNSNGLYDPLSGDYPAVVLRGIPPFVADEFAWCVFNDEGAGAPHGISGGAGMNMEVQLTAWAFNCPGQSPISNTLFTAHKTIYRGFEAIDSCFVGFFVDPDLGCYSDDFYGCNPALNTFYAYNADQIDGNPGTSCGGVPTFSGVPPVQSVTFLSTPMEKFIGINNAAIGTLPPGTTDPTLPAEYYRYLTGSWRDGSPITYGGSGYQSGGAATDYIFPDNPSQANGWSMCTASLPLGDSRCLGVTQPGIVADENYGRILPGQVDEYVLAWTVHPNPDLPCGLGNTFAEVAQVRAAYENGFADICLSSNTATPAGQSVDVFPNPAHSTVTLQYGDWPVQEIRLFNAEGRLVQMVQVQDAGQTELRIGDLPNGLYTAQIRGEGGTAVVKISVVH